MTQPLPQEKGFPALKAWIVGLVIVLAVAVVVFALFGTVKVAGSGTAVSTRVVQTVTIRVTNPDVRSEWPPEPQP